ncbi:MAG: valine--tRNA ligase [Minisyncoccota bacterium]
MMDERLLKAYNPNETEDRVYAVWEKSGFFNPDNLPGDRTEPFTIIMPPPNANGRLHVGHALTIGLEDIMIRYQRMRGKKALWVPGADHAGFETQVVYEKKLEKEGRSRFKMDRQELYREIMAFTLDSKQHMETDVKALGASCDWSREKFTLDPTVVSEVQETFRRLYRDNLIYRGHRTVNWCTKHQTSLSDVETETVEKNDKLYYITYGPFVVATVRPETIFGDVAIAVHPSDERYQKFIGQTIEVQHPEGVLSLTVIADEAVDKEFGTGALKITPAHDHNDFKVSETHKLPRVEVIDQFGKLNTKTGKYAGMKIAEARTNVVEDLSALGLIEKIEDYTHPVPTCYKCGTTIEPRVMPQWFVRMAPLAKLAADAVRAKKIQFIPDNFEKIFLYWMDNSIDWNISRQIVWGIQIPAFVCTVCNTGILDTDVPPSSLCPSCGAVLTPDTDTFDTWFSSGQWPLLALGYPNKKDLTYYPTSVMETGRDLIFKWIPRMVMFGLYLTGEVPFHTVYLNGMVNDKHGKKMSKSKGNTVSPIELSQKYGADALRMGLVIGTSPGNDLSLQEDKIKGYKHFANKVWNAARFVLTATEGADLSTIPTLTARDEEILVELDALVKTTTEHIEAYRFHLAAEELYAYFWHTFADIIIEEQKKRLADPTQSPAARYVLFKILKNSIALLHPFMPFVTEELWSILRSAHPEAFADHDQPLLIVSPWPHHS